MQTYSIAIKYVAYAYYTIDANSPEEAETQAWDDVDSDPDHAIRYGEWETESIEECKA